MINIEKGHAMPQVAEGEAGRVRDILTAMEKGDSFLYPLSDKGNVYYAAKTLGLKVTARNEGEGVRFWLVK